MALDVLGYQARSSPARASGSRIQETDGRQRTAGFYMQPCFSPIWDTAIAAYALGETENPPLDALRRAADWMISKEVRRKGDWSVKRPNVSPRAGPSSSTMSFIPMSTTPLWCCSRLKKHAPPTRLSKALAKSAPSIGCLRCKAKTAVGPPSTSITIGNF